MNIAFYQKMAENKQDLHYYPFVSRRFWSFTQAFSLSLGLPTQTLISDNSKVTIHLHVHVAVELH